MQGHRQRRRLRGGQQVGGDPGGIKADPGHGKILGLGQDPAGCQAIAELGAAQGSGIGAVGNPDDKIPRMQQLSAVAVIVEAHR